MYRVVVLNVLFLGTLPCAAQGIMFPAQGTQPAAALSPSPQLPTSPVVPAPAIRDLNVDPLKGLQPSPDIGKFPPQVVSWIHLRAAGLARGGEVPAAEDMQAYISRTGAGILGNLSGTDIMEVAFLVMMEAAKSAQEDLKSIMEESKRGSEANKGSKDQQERLGQDEMSLRLQAAMDRQSKLYETLSNLMKKISETESGIAGNLK